MILKKLEWKLHPQHSDEVRMGSLHGVPVVMIIYLKNENKYCIRFALCRFGMMSEKMNITRYDSFDIACKAAQTLFEEKVKKRRKDLTDQLKDLDDWAIM